MGIAKSLFYHDRTYGKPLGRAAETSVPDDEREALRVWLPRGRVDQKRADALAMLEAMQALLAGDAEPMRVDYALEWTEMWDNAATTSAASRLTDAEGAAAWIAEDRVLEELRLEADTYCGMRDRALLGLLAEREAGRRRQRVDRTGLRARSAVFAPAMDCSRAPTLSAGWPPTASLPNGWRPSSKTRCISRRSGRWLSPSCAIACSTSCGCAATMRGSRRAAGTSRNGWRRKASTIPSPRTWGR